MIVSDKLATSAGRLKRQIDGLRDALHNVSLDMTDEDMYYLRDSFMFVQKQLETVRTEISKLELEAVAVWEAAKKKRLRVSKKPYNGSSRRD